MLEVVLGVLSSVGVISLGIEAGEDTRCRGSDSRSLGSTDAASTYVNPSKGVAALAAGFCHSAPGGGGGANG